MAAVLLFHHALGLTSGVRAFVDDLRADGHTVHAPDLYDGAIFGNFGDAVAHARRVGFETILSRSVAIAESGPADVVYIGMSLGAMAAQRLAQTRAGARGAVLLHGAVPLGEFAPEWPPGVPAQIHVMTDDDWGDVDDAKAIAASSPDVQLYLYPGDRHLFIDSSLADQHDAPAARLTTERVLELLRRASA